MICGDTKHEDEASGLPFYQKVLSNAWFRFLKFFQKYTDLHDFFQEMCECTVKLIFRRSRDSYAQCKQEEKLSVTSCFITSYRFANVTN